MPNDITITNITGTSPYDLYVCDVTNTLCVFISGLTSVPPIYTFIVPPPLNTSGSLLIKIIDGDGCERFEYYSCVSPTPTPTFIFYITGEDGNRILSEISEYIIAE
jgi:hypothetical protein